MFHVRDHLYVGRRLDGSVRLLKLRGGPPHWPEADRPHQFHVSLIEFDETIADNLWPGCFAAVSKQGQSAVQFYDAQALHNNPAPASPPIDVELVARSRALASRIEAMPTSWRKAAMLRAVSDLLHQLVTLKDIPDGQH